MATIPVVNTIDKRKGAIVALLSMLLLGLFLFLYTFEMADPPPVDEVVVAQMQIPEELDLKNFEVDGGAGSGSPKDAPVNNNLTQTEKVITKKDNPDTQVNTGESQNSNTHNSQNETPNPVQSDNPFASGGTGDGNEGGQGNAFGSDTGIGDKGAHGGSGTGKGRIRKTDPVFTGLESNVDVIVSLKMTIDDQGNVIEAISIKAKTNTTDQRLINKVIESVKKQVKYNPEPGAQLAKVYMSVKIKAT